MARMVKCAKLGKELPAIPYKPFNNELGQRIYDNVSLEAWKMWLEFSKMIVNEYRVDLTSASRVRSCCTSRRRSTSSARGRRCRPTTSRPRPSSRRPRANVRARGDILLVSCYEPGHQPQAIASAVAFLRGAGLRADLPRSRGRASGRGGGARLAAARLVVVLGARCTPRWRSGLRVAARVRRENPARAPLLLRPLRGAERGACSAGRRRRPRPRLRGAPGRARRALDRGGAAPPAAAPRRRRRAGAASLVPERDALPPLARYARLAIAGEQRVAGHVEATRGCKHLCRHCPIPPVYDGRFFAVPADIVLEDARRADRRRRAPHRLRRSRLPERAAATRCGSPGRCTRSTPRVTFSFTAKVEHIVAATARSFPELAAAGRAVRRERGRVAVGPRCSRRSPRGTARPTCREALAIVRGAGPLPAADVRRVHALDDARRLPGALPLHPRASGSRTRSTPCSSRSGCWSRPGSLLLGAARHRPVSGRARRGGAHLPLARTPTRAWTGSRPTSPRWSRRRRRGDEPPADDLRPHSPARGGRRRCPRRGAAPRAGIGRGPAPPPHLTEPWFCCAQPTRRQLGAV